MKAIMMPFKGKYLLLKDTTNIYILSNNVTKDIIEIYKDKIDRFIEMLDDIGLVWPPDISRYFDNIINKSVINGDGCVLNDIMEDLERMSEYMKRIK